MFKKESQEKDFYDSYVYERLLPAKHILLDIKKTIDFSFVGKETKDLYSKTMGRPGFPPEVLFKMLFLEFFYNLSDYDAEEQVKTNILFRYFVGLGISSPTPDNTTLAMFRKRLGEERFKKLFDSVVIQAKTKGLIQGKLKILDATHIEADIAIQSAINLLRQGRNVIVKKISKKDPVYADVLKAAYVNEEKICNPPTGARMREELSITKNLIENTRDRFEDEEIQDLIRLLETALGQQERKANDPEHKEPDELVAFSDKDARRGAKSKTKRFVGYKAHISMDEGSHIVTSANTLPGNTNEGNKDETKAILDDDASKGITHKAVAADSLYDSYDNRNNIRSENMRAFIPDRGRNCRRSLDIFTYDHTTDTLVCPAGHNPTSRSRQERRDIYIFSAKTCAGCPMTIHCPKTNHGRVRVIMSDTYRLSILDNVPEKKDAFIKRKSIERKFGEAKVWHWLKRARYRQRSRVAIQVFMTFIVLNIKRMAHLLFSPTEYALPAAGSG